MHLGLDAVGGFLGGVDGVVHGVRDGLGRGGEVDWSR